MRKMLIKGFVASFGVLAAVAPAYADSTNPIFGHASVQATTPSENKNIVGKGYYADLYGYYGNYYSAYASVYGAMGYYSQSYGDYSTASSYAYDAYLYYSYASTAQAGGY